MHQHPLELRRSARRSHRAPRGQRYLVEVDHLGVVGEIDQQPLDHVEHLAPERARERAQHRRGVRPAAAVGAAVSDLRLIRRPAHAHPANREQWLCLGSFEKVTKTIGRVLPEARWVDAEYCVVDHSDCQARILVCTDRSKLTVTHLSVSAAGPNAAPVLRALAGAFGCEVFDVIEGLLIDLADYTEVIDLDEVALAARRAVGMAG